MQLYATNKFEVAAHHIKRAENAGCTGLAVTVDRSGGRNQETLFRLQRTDNRDCSACHDNSSLVAAQRDKPMYEGVDLSGLRNIQSSAMTWDYLKRLRDLTKMKVVIKGLLAWEDAKLAADNGYDAIIVSNHGARAEDSGRATIDALPEIVEAVNGRMPILIEFGFRRGTDICKALCMGATGVARRPALSVGARRLRPARRRAGARTVAHRAFRHHAAGRRAVGQASYAGHGAPRLRRIFCRHGAHRRLRRRRTRLD